MRRVNSGKNWWTWLNCIVTRTWESLELLPHVKWFVLTSSLMTGETPTEHQAAVSIPDKLCNFRWQLLKLSTLSRLISRVPTCRAVYTVCVHTETVATPGLRIPVGPQKHNNPQKRRKICGQTGQLPVLVYTESWNLLHFTHSWRAVSPANSVDRFSWMNVDSSR